MGAPCPLDEDPYLLPLARSWAAGVVIDACDRSCGGDAATRRCPRGSV